MPGESGGTEPRRKTFHECTDDVREASRSLVSSITASPGAKATSGTLFFSTLAQDKELSDLTSRTKRSSSAMKKRFNQCTLRHFTDSFRADWAARFGAVTLLLEPTTESG